MHSGGVRSRYEQAPGSGFYFLTKVKKGCGFLWHHWSNKKEDPDRYVSFGSYELLMSNVANQMNDKWIIKNNFSFYLGKISLKF